MFEFEVFKIESKTTTILGYRGRILTSEGLQFFSD